MRMERPDRHPVTGVGPAQNDYLVACALQEAPGLAHANGRYQAYSG